MVIKFWTKSVYDTLHVTNFVKEDKELEATENIPHSL